MDNLLAAARTNCTSMDIAGLSTHMSTCGQAAYEPLVLTWEL
jgi:hypothetical protein